MAAEENEELLENEEINESEEEELLKDELQEEGPLHDGVEVEDRQKKRSCLQSVFWSITDTVFPPLTSGSGKVKLSRKRSCIILLLLYISHIFSAWGDRMWTFANSLFVALLYPGSLLMPAIFGLITQLFVVVFGTIVGDWVDTNPRMRVAWMSLLIQNSLVAVSSVILSLMFYFSWDVCNSALLFGLLVTGVILLGSLANLATVANTIAIERDWIVVIADNNSNTLAVLNANMRRFDLLCKLLAPIFAGVLLAHTSSFLPCHREELAGGFVATVFIGIWNVVSFFGELSLLFLVYKLVPALANKRLRGKTNLSDDEEEEEEEEVEVKLKPSHVQESSPNSKSCLKVLEKLATPYNTLRNGWSIFWRQEINLVGFSLAALYLTVLGFSGVTATYFLTQGLTSDLIGLFYGIGGIFGISGTFVYPFLRRRLGTVRAGLTGSILQVSLLTFCVIGAFLPSKPIANDDRGYYSANCTYNVSIDSICPSPTSSLSSTFIFGSSPSSIFDPSSSSIFGPSHSIFGPSPFPSNDFLLMSPSPSPPPPLDREPGSSINIVSIALILVGIIGARFGLWMFDLAVSQLIQERVIEEERGVVSGVMNAMNSNMDMLQYVLVVIVPRPQDFRYLTLVSYASVSTGLFFYVLYVFRAYGYTLNSCSKYCRKKQPQPQLSLVTHIVNDEL